MKIKDIAKLGNDIDEEELEQFLKSRYRIFVKTSMFGSTLDDSVNISSMLQEYSVYHEEKVAKREKERLEKEEAERLKREAEQKAIEDKRRAEEEAHRSVEALPVSRHPPSDHRRRHLAYPELSGSGGAGRDRDDQRLRGR